MKKKYILVFLILSSGWNVVNAASLSSLYTETIDSNPSLIISGARKLAGEARFRQAEGNLLPQISLSGTSNRTRLNDSEETSFNGETYSLSLTQTLFDIGKNELKNTSRFDAQKLRENYNDELSKISLDLIERYVAVLSAEDLVKNLKAEQALLMSQLQGLKSQYERQLAVLTDVLDISARLDGVNAQIIGAANSVEITRDRLAGLVGRPVDEPLARFKENAFSGFYHKEDLQHWLDVSLANNSSLAALRHGIESAKSDVRLGKSGYYPVVDLQLSAQRTNIGSENIQIQKRGVFVGAINLTVPIFSGGTTTAIVEEKRAMLIEAQAIYEGERRKIVTQVREAYLNTKANIANISASKKAISSAKVSYEAMSKGYKYETVTVVDVLDSIKQVLSITTEYHRYHYDYAVNWIRLMNLSGKDSMDSINMASSWLLE